MTTTALVTGGGRGIGKAITQALTKAGVKVVAISRSKKELLESGAAHFHVADLSDFEEATATIDQLLKKYGSFDILVNNAGMSVLGSAEEGNPKDWLKMLQLNLHTPMLFTRKIAPAMIKKEQGIIINIGSVAAIEGMKWGGAYAASKHGLRGWSLSCYERLRPYGIKVVLINPAYVNTAMVQGVNDVDFSRMLLPEDVAESVMLAVRTSPMCCPVEITLRLTKPAYLS